MNKLKKAFIGIISAVLVCVAIYGGMLGIRRANRKPVPVYKADVFAMKDFWGDTSETYGNVTLDRLQKVYTTETQTVNSIAVSEGQTVHKGDLLLTFDTTLSELDLLKAQITLEKAQNKLEEEKSDLSKLLRKKSIKKLEEEREEYEAQIEKLLKENPQYRETMPALPCGSGHSAEDPCYMDDCDGLDAEYELGDLDELYLVLVTVEGEEYTEYQGVYLYRGDDGTVKMKMYPAEPLEPEEPLETSEKIKKLRASIKRTDHLIEESYSKSDLAKLINEKNHNIEEAQLEIQIAELDLRKKQSEVSDGAVYSKIDGVVKTVKDPQEAFRNSEPVLEISGGGGYFVTGSLSELELGEVLPGQTVNINSWMSGASCTGEIVEIGTVPNRSDGWSNGNDNVSWYPMRVFVSEDANLREGESVSIAYSSNEGDESTWYLQNMFIRSLNGKSYVFVRGENGLLEKRWIKTGRDLWGSYTEIRGGVTTEDFIAFPYGKDVAENAKTVERDEESFYSMM